MKNSASFIIALGIFLGFAALGISLHKGILSIKAAERTVIVKGLAEKEVFADSVVWPIMFRTNANTLDELSINMDKSTQKIQNFLLQNGIEKNEITIMPPYIEDKGLYSSQENRPIYAYTAATTITVNSQKVKHIAQLTQDIGALVQKGIALENRPMHTKYTFTKLNELKPQMIEQATKNARDVAEKFAKDSQSFLGKIKKAHQGVFTISTPDNYKPQIKKIRIVSTVEYYLVD